MHKHQLVICHFMLSLHETVRYVPKTHLSLTTVFIMMYFEGEVLQGTHSDACSMKGSKSTSVISKSFMQYSPMCVCVCVCTK